MISDPFFGGAATAVFTSPAGVSSSSLSVLKTDVGAADEFTMAGIDSTATFQLHVAIEDFSGSVPSAGWTVRLGSTTYSVISVRTAPDGVGVTIDCNTVTQ
jgi:hypothetical protein